MSTRRVSPAPAHFAYSNVVLVGPATFNMQLSGQVPYQGRCVAAETVSAGCGTRSFSKYAIGLLASIGVDTGGRFSWAPGEYTKQRLPDYSTCGGKGTVNALSFIQPFWLGKYDKPAEFQLSEVTNGPTVGDTKARARKAAASKFLSTPVGKALVLRHQQRPPTPSGGFTGLWTGEITFKRLR